MEKTKNISLLVDENYANWKFEIKMLLKQKELFHAVTFADAEEYFMDELDMSKEDIEKMDAKELVKHNKAWKRDNEKAIAYIGQYVDKKFYKYIADEKAANTVWSNLESHFSSLNTANRMHVKIEFYKAQQTRNESLLTYLERVVAITDKLRDLGWDTPDLEICIKVLSSLADEFRPVQLSCLMIPEDKLTTSILRQQFAMDGGKKKTNHAGMDGDVQANFSRTLFCTECGYDNHLAKNCKAPQARKDAFKARKAKEGQGKTAHGHATEVSAIAFSTGVIHSSDTASSNSVGAWYIDSGATHHMTNDPTMVQKATDSNITVLGSLKMEQNISSIVGETQVNDSLTLNDVIVVPDLRKNLLSISKITEVAENEVKFKGDIVKILHNDSLVATGTKDASGLYVLDDKIVTAEANLTQKLWHLRMGHISDQKLNQLRDSLAEGIQFSSCSHDLGKSCENCALGKQIRAKISKINSPPTAEKFGDVIYSDVCGPITPLSLGGNSYFVSFVDDSTRASWVYLMKSKDETLDKFKEFRKEVKTQFKVNIMRLHSDRGGEYISTLMDGYCKSKGIIHSFTPPDTPQLNGVAERYNRFIVEMVRCMLFSKKLDKSFWGEAIFCANFIRNRVPNSKIGTTPYEKLNGKKPNLKNIKVFGSVVTYVPATYKHKLDKRCNNAILIGFSSELSSYKVWDVERNKAFFTRDIKVIDEESVVPVPKENLLSVSPISSILDAVNPATNVVDEPNFILISSEDSDEEQASSSTPILTNPILVQSSTDDDSTLSLQRGNPVLVPLANDLDSNSKATSETSFDSSATMEFGGPNVAGEDSETAATHYTVSHTEALLTDIGSKLIICNDPSTYEEAMKSDDKPEWIKAMAKEMNSFISNDVFESIKLAHAPRFIDGKWVFKRKFDADGNVVRHKARLVAKGFRQKYGIDYFEVYAPVVRYETIRILVSYAAYSGMSLRHFDVETAFLNGDLEEELFLKFPAGCGDLTDKIVKLKKSIYGLKQSGRMWNLKIASLLINLGFKQSQADQCLFIKGEGANQILIGLFVDDILSSGQPEQLDSLFRDISSVFKLKDLGEVSKIVGLEIKRTSEIITVDQSQFIRLILEKFGMSDCKPMDTPMIANNESSKMEFEDKSLFRQAVGSLNYLSVGTRPDISYAVYHVSTKMVNPTVSDWKEILRIFRYLRGTIDLKLTYRCNLQSESLHGFSDASYASRPKAKSMSGYVFLMNGGAITWRAKKQNVTATSSTEAEYVALADAAREAVWLRQITGEISSNYASLLILEDNQSSINSAKGNTDHSRSKHIDVKHHFIRDMVKSKKVKLDHIATENMTADILTKPLGRILFQKHRSAMSLI